MNPHERRLPGELVFVLVAVLFALTALWQAYRISGFASWSSPGAVPMFAALVMVLSGLKIAVGTWRRPPPANVPGVSRATAFAQALFPRVVVLFTLLIYWLHLPLGALITYANGIFILIYLLCMLAGARILKGRSTWMAMLGAVLCCGLLAMVGWKAAYALVVFAALWLLLPRAKTVIHTR